jgi:hypothetical protein
MTKSNLQFGAAVVMACAALFALASIMASTTTTTFKGADAGCANLTLSDPISATSVSRNRPALRVSRMTG